MLTVSAIGSCRVFTPLNLVRRRKEILTGHANAEWYTHSTKDVLQKLEVMNAEKLVPTDVIPMLIHGMHKYFPDVIKSGFYQNTDVFVIEIASIKLFLHEGWYLQQWCVHDAEKGLMDDERSVALAKSATRTVQTKDELVSDMLEIVSRLSAPVVFVPHVNCLGRNGAPIPERVLIREAIIEACEQCAAKMFDPTPHVFEVGYQTAMSDVGHYRNEFNLPIGRKLAAFINDAYGPMDAAHVSAAQTTAA